jgi:hypothetical protein
MVSRLPHEVEAILAILALVAFVVAPGLRHCTLLPLPPR